MKAPQNSYLLLVLALSLAGAQQNNEQKRPALKPTSPSVNCSEARSSKACGSFKQLVDARDKDILDSLSSKPTYVCFRPNEDAFLLIHVQPPSPYIWRTADDGVGQTQDFQSSVNLTEYRDGVFYTIKDGRASWYRSSPNSEPLFHSESTQGIFKGLKITVYPTEISFDYPFNNQNGGTTQYSLTIRRSTGRFTETFTTETAPVTTHSGSCLIYR